MAAVDYFLKIDGISGESTDDKHRNEIEVESFSWGVSNSASLLTGGGAGAGRASFSDFAFMTRLNKASPSLFLKCASGQHIKQAVLTARTAGEQPVEFLKITLSDILVSSYQTSGGGDAPTDASALRYGKAQFSEGPQQRISVAPSAAGVLAYDPTTKSYEVVDSPNGTMTIGTMDGVVSRAVQEFDVRDILGLLTAPMGTGTLRLTVNEVREATTNPGVASIASDPGDAREGAEPHLHFDVVLCTPADLALTPADLTRRGERIGSLHLDPRRDPTSLELDLSSRVREAALGTFGIRLQLRGAPLPPPDADVPPPDTERSAHANGGEGEDDPDKGLGRRVSASFTTELVFDTA